MRGLAERPRRQLLQSDQQIDQWGVWIGSEVSCQLGITARWMSVDTADERESSSAIKVIGEEWRGDSLYQCAGLR